MQEAMDLEAAAKLLGVSPHTVRAWARSGRLAHFKLGRRLVFDRADLDAFLGRKRVEARDQDQDGERAQMKSRLRGSEGPR